MKEFSFEKIVKDPAVFADNRLPARSDHTAFASAEELAAGESSLRLCLDGVWSFRYARNPAAAPDGFWADGYDVSGWDCIHVPAHIQMEGYDRPAYINTQYPWDADEDLQPGEVPALFNPVADYVRDFTLPASFPAVRSASALRAWRAALPSGSTGTMSATARTASRPRSST